MFWRSQFLALSTAELIVTEQRGNRAVVSFEIPAKSEDSSLRDVGSLFHFRLTDITPGPSHEDQSTRAAHSGAVRALEDRTDVKLSEI